MAEPVSQDQAQWLFHEGATVVFLDVPPGTEFGVDYNSWKVGSEFKGVKMIPPGVHLIYYSAVGIDRQVAPRTGFMHNFRQREVLVKVWDKQLEDMKPGSVTAEEQERIESNKQELDRFLGAYPYESYKKWVSLTNLITPNLMTHLLPENGKICAVTPLLSVGSTTQSRREAREAEESKSPDDDNHSTSKWSKNEGDSEDSRLPNMQPCPGTQVQFTPIPRKKHPDGATVEEITRCNMDHSYVLKCTLESSTYDGDSVGLLGEMQFAFVSFLIGQVFEGFEQWKRLVNLLCSCVDAIAAYPSLFTKFMSVLHFHIQEIPEDFFVDIVSQDNFLTGTLSRFFENLDASGAGAELKKRGLNFRSHLEKRFRWNFSSELDEYAPVVVL